MFFNDWLFCVSNCVHFSWNYNTTKPVSIRLDTHTQIVNFTRLEAWTLGRTLRGLVHGKKVGWVTGRGEGEVGTRRGEGTDFRPPKWRRLCSSSDILRQHHNRQKYALKYPYNYLPCKCKTRISYLFCVQFLYSPYHGYNYSNLMHGKFMGSSHMGDLSCKNTTHIKLWVRMHRGTNLRTFSRIKIGRRFRMYINKKNVFLYVIWLVGYEIIYVTL